MILHGINIQFSSLLFGCLFTCFISQNLQSQNTSVTDKNIFFNNQKYIWDDSLHKKVTVDYPFIIGRNHTPIVNIDIHPYFNENKWLVGSLVFNGVNYKFSSLKYDIENDKLIILLINNYENTSNCIELDENFIQDFTLSKTSFRYYSDLNTESGKKLKTGYYEIVYDGKLKFLVHKEKTKGLTEYKVSTNMFLLKDGKPISINSLGKIASILNDRTDEIKKFIKDNSLKLSNSDYISVFKILQFYENL